MENALLTIPFIIDNNELKSDKVLINKFSIMAEQLTRNNGGKWTPISLEIKDNKIFIEFSQDN